MTKRTLPPLSVGWLRRRWKGVVATLVAVAVAAAILVPIGVRQWRFTHGPDWSTDLDRPRGLLDANDDSLLFATSTGVAVLSRATGAVREEYEPDSGFDVFDAALVERGVVLHEGRKAGEISHRVGRLSPDGTWAWKKDIGNQLVLGVDPDRHSVTISDNDKRIMYAVSLDTGDAVWSRRTAGSFNIDTDQPLVHPFHEGLSWADDDPRTASDEYSLVAGVSDGRVLAEGEPQFEIGAGGVLAASLDDKRPCQSTSIWNSSGEQPIKWGTDGAPNPCRVLSVGSTYAYVEEIPDDRGADPTLENLIGVYGVNLRTGEATAIDLATDNENPDDSDVPERWFVTKERTASDRPDEDYDPEARPDILRIYDAKTGKKVWGEPWTDTWAAHTGPDAVLTLRTPTSRFERGDDPRNEKVFELREPSGDVISRVYGRDREWIDTNVLAGQEAVLILDDTVVMMR